MHNLNAVLLAAEMEPRLFDLDFQLLADSLLTIIAVFVLFIALSYLLFNPARKFMQDRQNKIAGELDHAKTAQEDAEKLKEMILEAGAKDAVIGEIGPVVGAHCGRGTLAVYSICETR